MSGSGAGPVVPAGQYPPFAIVTDTEHAAWILIATALGLAITLLFSGIRIFIRVFISPGYGLDDALLAAATGVGIIQSSLVLGACAHGLGKSIELVSPSNQLDIQQLYYASNLLFIVAVGLSKLSVVFFLLRLTRVNHHRLAFYTIAGVVIAWIVVAVFSLVLQCKLSQPWILVDAQCSGMLLRWQIIAAFDVLTEVLIVAGSWFLVWSLYASVAKKIIVVGAFGFRLIMVMPMAFRLATFNKNGLTTNPFLLESAFIVWTQTELSYSLIAATIPALRPLVNNLNTQFGGLGHGEGSNGYGYGYAADAGAYGSNNSGDHTHSNGSYQMSNLKSIDREPRASQTTVQDQMAALDPRPNGYRYGVAGASKGDATQQAESKRDDRAPHVDATCLESNDSRRMIIHKDVAWQVELQAPAL